MLFESLGMDFQSTTILSLAVMLLVAFLLTRITKRCKLPNVTGYILAGICIGPYVLRLVPQSTINGMEFVTDVALALIAFDVGRYLRLNTLKSNSKQVLLITCLEALLAAVVVTSVMYFVFHLSLPFSLLLGAIGSATAPASTIMTIRQYKAKGIFVDVLLQVVALDDVVALVAFSVCAAVSQALGQNGHVDTQVVLLPILLNLLAVALGLLGGFLLSKIINEKRTSDNRLILTVMMILLITGFCCCFSVSPLLSCMAMGAVYANCAKNDALFTQVREFSPPILTLFFVLSGMRLDLNALKTVGIIGVAYFFVRIIGKYAGAALGCKLGRAPKELTRYLGLALIPQAGVSIGLAILAQRMLPDAMGSMLSAIILSSSVLYEMIGPACAKIALHLSGAIPEEMRGKKPDFVDEEIEEAPQPEAAPPQLAKVSATK